MGVNSVSGTGPVPSFAANASNAPAPPLRQNEGASSGSPPSAAAAPKPREEQVQKAAKPKEAGGGPQLSVTRLRVDPDTKRIIAQILDDKGKVIRQVPPEELLQISARSRQIEGLIFNRQT